MKVLVVEDDPQRWRFFKHWLQDDEVIWATTAAQAKVHLMEREFDLVCLDHDLADQHYEDLEISAMRAEGTGRDVAEVIAKMDNPPFVIIHSWNPHGAQAIQSILSVAGVPNCRRHFSAVIETLIKQVRKQCTKS